ncbi:erythromycin esterase family protein [Nonomuraea sp. NPDC050328]|uniref:erythromycin esterase family protein n=1 Tax=Nonomuraea sp. NPDC050328 TaxID=3364361 RepID=UPI0037AC1B45
MDIKDFARPFDGAGVSAFLRSLPAAPRLLGLGEARHFVGELGEARNELFRHLVEHEGYRSFALESDCLMGQVVDRYLATGEGDLDEVMERGFSHGFGASPANRELVRWMRAYNAEHGTRLRFFGFDGPLEYWAASPREALTGLYALLDGPLLAAIVSAETLDELLGADERWSNEAAAMDPARSIGRSPEAERLRVIADDLVALLETRTPQLDPAEREQAELYARTAVGLLRYHYWMADASPQRWGRLSALRDAMMAANLRALAAHGPALIYSSNLHLQRDQSVMALGEQSLEWWSAGALVSAALGEQYAFLASALGTLDGDAPAPGTVEALLSGLPWDAALVDARRLAETAGQADRRVTGDFAYFPVDPAQLGRIDGLLFLRRADDLKRLG